MDFFSNLLDFESDDKLLSYTVSKYNIPIWLYIRFGYFWHIQKKQFNLSEPHVKIKTSSLTFIQKIKYIYFSIRYNPFFIKKHDVVIFGEGINNVKEGDFYTNRLYNDFIDDCNFDMVFLESSSRFQYFRPNRHNKIFYSDLLKIIPALFSVFFVSRKNINNIENFLMYLQEKSSSDISDFILENRSRMYKLSAKISISIFLYRIFFKITKPKFVFFEDAHYGGLSHILYLAKQNGIKTGEFQHGYIGKNHLAYNFNKTIYAKLVDFLPDYLLTFGDFWSNNTSTPSCKVSVGFPYLSRKATMVSKDEKFILFVSGGTFQVGSIDFCAKLIKHPFFSEYKFLFRPHPSERLEANKRYNQLIELGYLIDEENIYEILKSVDIVISCEVSTVLYESILFTNKVFLVFNDASSQYIDSNMPFVVSKNIDDIVFTLKESNFETNCYNVWDTDSINKFNLFLSRVL